MDKEKKTNEKQELSDEEISKASGGVHISDINGHFYCPNESCDYAFLQKTNDDLEDNCGDTYDLYKCPVCGKKYRLYHPGYKWTND